MEKELEQSDNSWICFPEVEQRGLGMNKRDLIQQVAEDAGLTHAEATKAVESVLRAISRTLKKGDEVRIVGFGTFSVTNRKASTGRNPRTGEPLKIKASRQAKFKAGKLLALAIGGGDDGWGGPKAKP
jgi:DNA-binding protein HU-beta